MLVLLPALCLGCAFWFVVGLGRAVDQFACLAPQRFALAIHAAQVVVRHVGAFAAELRLEIVQVDEFFEQRQGIERRWDVLHDRDGNRPFEWVMGSARAVACFVPFVGVRWFFETIFARHQ